MRGRLLAFAGGIAALGAAWWVCSRLVPAGFLPAPLPVLARFIELLPGALAAHTAASLGRVAAALILYLGRGSGPEPASVVVSAEDRGATVLETSDGPVVLFGEPEPEGS